MPSFFLAFAAVLLTSIGSRDQMLMAQLSGGLGRRLSLLVAGWIVAGLTAMIMALAGEAAAHILPQSGKIMLIALALLLASAELAWPNFQPAAKEPTRSLAAILFVLFSRQLGDAGRFLVFAISAATAAPQLAGMGGWLGGGAALTIGWLMADQWDPRIALRIIRRILAAVLFVSAIVVGLSARGLISSI